MSAARDEILARIRGIDRTPAPGPIDRSYRRVGALAPADRVERFAARVADYRADVRRAATDGIAAAIASACADHGASRVAIPATLPHAWRPPALELVEDDGLSPHELDRLDGVVTGCTLAIAETGTIVLSGGESEGRRALTLVPDLHVCVVRADQVVELVPEAFDALDATRPTTFISGPSATSDIELIRVEGVHGPRTLVVLIVGCAVLRLEEIRAAHERLEAGEQPGEIVLSI